MEMRASALTISYAFTPTSKHAIWRNEIDTGSAENSG